MARVIQNVQLCEDARDEWLLHTGVGDAASDSGANDDDHGKLFDVVTIGRRVASVTPSASGTPPISRATIAWQNALDEAVAAADRSGGDGEWNKDREDLAGVLAAALQDRYGLTSDDLHGDGKCSGELEKDHEPQAKRALAAQPKCLAATWWGHGGGRSPQAGRSIHVGLLEVVDGEGGWLLPGWIDMQVNDLAWMARWEKETFTVQQHADRIRDLLRHQGASGVTSLCIATIAAPVDKIVSYLEAMKQVMDGQNLAQSRTDGSARTQAAPPSFLHGAIVEGTFMNPECHGCHNPKYVVPPSAAVMKRLLETKAVKTVNIAPEMGDEEETLELIRNASQSGQGILVAAGHCKPHAEMLRKAVEAGCSYVIHLGNGSPTGSSFKTACDGGLMQECLRNDGITVTVICDNHHVHPALVRDWAVRKYLQRMVAVSDVAFALGLEGVDQFEVFGRKGKLSLDGKCLVQADLSISGSADRSSDKVAGLFGSATTMRDSFENLVNLFTSAMLGVHHRHHPALLLKRAVSIASAMCSGNPAKLLGKPASFGTICSGGTADLILARISRKPGNATGADSCAVATLPKARFEVTVRRVWSGSVKT